MKNPFYTLLYYLNLFKTNTAFSNMISDQKGENQHEHTKISENEKRIKNLAKLYYSRTDIQKAIFDFSKNRETIPRYFEGFGKRPDTLEYSSEVFQAIKKGATSFHCSEELWNNPLQIKQDFTEEDYNQLRIGWDLLIDIDSKYLDYSKIAAELIIQALEFSGIKNYGLKFSGSKGFHIIVPWKAFPKQVYNNQTKNMFPEYPRIISLYLTELIKPKLIEKITSLSGHNKSYIKDFEAPKKVMPDIILVSPRHLFRAPYSLHEKTALASIVIDRTQLEKFEPKQANPLKVEVKNFYPSPIPEEAKELLISALDWYKEHKKEPTTKDKLRKFQQIKINKRKIIYPPAIEKILQGLKDGKKRALFILLNYFRSLNFNFDEIEKILLNWNKKNHPNLKQGYIQAQLSWHKRQPARLPPNYDKDYYKGIGINPTPEELNSKNPVSFTIKQQLRQNNYQSNKRKK